MTTTNLTPAEQFFYDYAGWGYNPANETEDEGHRRCARELAVAAEYSKRQGWTYFWTRDVNGCQCDQRKCRETYVCHMYATYEWDSTAPVRWVAYKIAENTGHNLAYRDGLCDPDVAYMRVIEAELALEAMPSEELQREMAVRA